MLRTSFFVVGKKGCKWRKPTALTTVEKQTILDILGPYPQQGGLYAAVNLAVVDITNGQRIETNFPDAVSMVASASLIRTYSLRRDSLLGKGPPVNGVDETIDSLRNSGQDARIYYFFTETSDVVVMLSGGNDVIGCLVGKRGTTDTTT